jgi:hypothetical protein
LSFSIQFVGLQPAVSIEGKSAISEASARAWQLANAKAAELGWISSPTPMVA